MGRKSILFFRSFYEAAQKMGEKSRLKFYDSILEASFSDYKTIEELKQNCAEIESKLKHFRTLSAQFSLVKPHIINSGESYLKGKKGGGQIGNTNAKKRAKNEQEEEEREKEKEKERDREIEREIEEELNSPEMFYFINTFKNKCYKDAVLSDNERLKLMNILNEFIIEGYDLKEITEVLCSNFNKIDPDSLSFTPTINWLLENNAKNFFSTLYGEYNKKRR